MSRTGPAGRHFLLIVPGDCRRLIAAFHHSGNGAGKEEEEAGTSNETILSDLDSGDEAEAEGCTNDEKGGKTGREADKGSRSEEEENNEREETGLGTRWDNL